MKSPVPEAQVAVSSGSGMNIALFAFSILNMLLLFLLQSTIQAKDLSLARVERELVTAPERISQLEAAASK